MTNQNYNTAADVFTAAENEYGTALGNMILAEIGLGTTPLPKARAEVAITRSALTEAAKLAAKNLTNQPAKEP
jgi:hypothetical protein